MLKNFRLIATVLVVAVSSFGAVAQTIQTNNYKDVLLNGKPAKLNLETGEITYTNGEIAKSRTAKKIKDSLLATRTEIKTNLIKDMSVTTQKTVVTDTVHTSIDKVENSKLIADTNLSRASHDSTEVINNAENIDLNSNTTLVSEQSEDKTDLITSNFHLVKKGETLYELSKRYKTSLNQLKRANNLETTLIKVGETLRVRNFEDVETDSDAIWIVSRGDTLYNIAKRNNTTVADLKDLNDLSGNLIKIGQKLHVNQNSTLSKK